MILFTAFAIAGIAAQAQVNFGVHAGISAASFTDKYPSGSGGQTTTDKFKTKVGLTVGVVAEMPIASSLFFRPELNFIQKGGKLTQSGNAGGFAYTDEATVTTNYLEIPLNVLYKFATGSGKVFVGAGPSIGYGLSGKYKAKSTFNGTTTEDKADIKFDGKKNATDNNVHYKALDFGANFLAGYQFSNNIFVKASYTIGFSNIAVEDNSTTKNKGFGFTIGYMFGGGSSEE